MDQKLPLHDDIVDKEINALKQKAEDYVQATKASSGDSAFSWVTPQDETVFTLENQRLEPSIRYGIPALSGRNLMNQQLIVGLINPSVKDNDSENLYEDKMVIAGNGLKFYARHYEDYNYFFDENGVNQDETKRNGLIEQRASLSSENFSSPTNIIEDEFARAAQWFADSNNNGKKFNMTDQMYYCKQYFNEFMYVWLTDNMSTEGTLTKHVDKLAALIARQDIAKLSLANIELLPYRSQHTAKITSWMKKIPLEAIPAVRISLLAVLNRALAYLIDPQNQTRPVFILRSYRTLWREPLKALLTELRDQNNWLKAKQFNFTQIEALIWVTCNEQRFSLSRNNLAKASEYVDASGNMQRQNKALTPLYNAEPNGASHNAYMNEIWPILHTDH